MCLCIIKNGDELRPATSSSSTTTSYIDEEEQEKDEEEVEGVGKVTSTARKEKPTFWGEILK